MLTKLPLARTLLLGPTWAVLAQSYVNQMTPKSQTARLRSAVTPVNLFQGRDAGRMSSFKSVLRMTTRVAPRLDRMDGNLFAGGMDRVAACQSRYNEGSREGFRARYNSGSFAVTTRQSTSASARG